MNWNWCGLPAAMTWSLRSGWILCCWILCSAISCQEQSRPTDASSKDQPTGTTRLFKTTESDSTGTRYVFRAQIARTYADDTTRAEQVEVDFYEDGKVASQLTSERAVLESGRMTAEGNVVVVSLEDGTILRTQRLYWEDHLEKIRTDVFFSVTKKNGDQLTGEEMISDPRLEFIDIKEPVLKTQSQKPNE